MIEKLCKTRIWLFIASIIFNILYVIVTLIDLFGNVDLKLEIIFCVVFGMVFFVLAMTYPIIYKAELMIAKMDEEEDKRDKH